MIDARACLNSHDILLIVLDTLRYDVAVTALERGQTPNLAAVLSGGRWEHRHSPASFTYAAHQAFFAGFLPTPVQPVATDPAAHQRLFAARFAGSETTGDTTMVLDAPDIVTGLAGHGYHTLCIGGTGFFNRQTPLGSVLPDLFHESWWDPTLGVADRNSAANQVALAVVRTQACAPEQRLFTFVNVSACHSPHHFYLPGNTTESTASQGAALAEFDRHLPVLLTAAQARAPVLLVICSDHGEAFGEDGYHGHRIGHPTVWDVPYAQALLPQARAG